MDIPMLFQDRLVREIQEGRKLQTRRPVSRHNLIIDGQVRATESHWGEIDLERAWVDQGPSPAGNTGPYLKLPCFHWEPKEQVVHRGYPSFSVGDRIWVRECWRSLGSYPDNGQANIEYRAGGRKLGIRTDDWAKYLRPDTKNWRPSIFLPRWASRITLDVTEVRIERLQSISAEDAGQEGFTSEGLDRGFYVRRLATVWDQVYGPKGLPWESNPWVIALTFRMV